MDDRLADFQRRRARNRMHARAYKLRKQIERCEQELLQLEEELRIGSFSHRKMSKRKLRIEAREVRQILELHPKQRRKAIQKIALRLGIERISVNYHLRQHLEWQQRNRPDLTSEGRGESRRRARA